MKYVVIIPDGAADMPLDQLGDKTPLEAAHTPAMDALARAGRQGTAVTTPADMPCGSDVCTMSLLGYDPARYHTGRAPLEAAALGIDIDPRDWVFRVNLITVIDGIMQDHSAGHITSAESRQLLEEFATRFDIPGVRGAAGLTLHPGVSYRNIMVDRSGSIDGIAPRDWSELQTTAPHDIPGQPIRKHLPVGGVHAPLLHQLIAESEIFLKDHEINLTRREMGEAPATHLWPWGQGTRPRMTPFVERFGIQRAAMITAVDLLAGIASFIGFDRLDVPGQTSYHDNDYTATGQYAAAALDHYDLLCVHVEAPDEASHAGDAVTKVQSIEAIDAKVVAPIHAALQQRNEPYRILILPDHYTRTDTRKHDPTPVPFLISGWGIHAVLQRPWSERNAEQADLHIAHGHELMEYFLFSGLDKTKSKPHATTI